MDKDTAKARDFGKDALMFFGRMFGTAVELIHFSSASILVTAMTLGYFGTPVHAGQTAERIAAFWSGGASVAMAS
jgi:hypothetical protein